MNRVEIIATTIWVVRITYALDGGLAKLGVIPGGGDITPMASSRFEIIVEYIRQQV